MSDPGLYGAATPSGMAEAQMDFAAGPKLRRPVVIEGRAYQVTERKRKSTGGFKAGEEVFHQKFGYGKIRAVEGDKLEIAFSTGVKKVLDSFVERA